MKANAIEIRGVESKLVRELRLFLQVRTLVGLSAVDRSMEIAGNVGKFAVDIFFPHNALDFIDGSRAGVPGGSGRDLVRNPSRAHIVRSCR